MDVVIVGTLAALASSLITFLITGQREARIRRDALARRRVERWHGKRLSALADVAETAARLEGSHFRRGRLQNGSSPDDLKRYNDRAKDELDDLYARTARASILAPELIPFFDELKRTEQVMRAAADVGFEREKSDELGSRPWSEVRDAHRAAIAALCNTSSEHLDTRIVDSAP
jgi:hypothetical protein